MVDLRDRLLKEGGLILPHRLRLFVAPVQAVDGLYAPFSWEETLHGLTFGALRPYAEATANYLYRVDKPFPLDSLFLAEPKPVVDDVDLLTVTPAEIPVRVSYSGLRAERATDHSGFACSSRRALLRGALDHHLTRRPGPSRPLGSAGMLSSNAATRRPPGRHHLAGSRWTDLAAPAHLALGRQGYDGPGRVRGLDVVGGPRTGSQRPQLPCRAPCRRDGAASR